MKPSTYPKITARIELISPAKAESYLATMTRNRRLKDSTVAMYANDMANGAWLISPQGIAFDDSGTLFDGQHRLRGVIRANLSVPLLVLRGFPTRQDAMNTMDAVDCGAGRSLSDRLKIMECYAGNPNLAVAVARQIACAVMGPNCRAARKLSLSNVLAIIAIWKSELGMVCQAVDRCHFPAMRNAYVVAALTIAAAVGPNKTRIVVEKLTTGAGLDERSPLLELRNAFITGRGGERSEKMHLCFSALLCEWHNLPGREIHKESNKKVAAKFFQDKQTDRFTQVTNLFLTH